MRGRDLVDFLSLAALWGASFLFMRLAVPAFGPVALMALRCGLAAALMLVWLAWRGQLRALRRSLARTALIGVAGSAIPFVLIGYALQSMPAGLASIVNATTPMWTALVGWLWFADRLPARSYLGILIGFLGVVGLAGLSPGLAANGSAEPTGSGSHWLALLACLMATLSYGIAANAARRYLQGIPPMLGATGSQIGASLALAPFALGQLPAAAPPAAAWASAIVLAVACTALAYLLFYRLLQGIGPQGASSVTYGIPLFGVLWGAVFLGERIEPQHLIGGAFIIVGSALVLGLGSKRRSVKAASADR